MTINEPGCLVFQGYVRSAFPPAKTNLTLAGTVTKNLMHAHVSTYQALKKLDCYAGTENESQIGLAHNIVQFEAYTKTSNLEKNISNYINHIFHESITNFLKTKKFVFDSRIGYLGNIIGERITWEPELKNNEKILDFIGLNYYSHMLFSLSWPFESRLRPGEYPTEMPYGIYPEGIYRAICQIAELGVPIYITENGIADAKDSRREFFLKRYLLAVSQAIREGYDVRGYFYWSLLDNFEWDMGFEKRFGLYAVDYKTQERILRPSALFYKNVIEKARNFNNTCDLLQVFNHTHLAFSKNHLNKLNNPYIYHLNQ